MHRSYEPVTVAPADFRTLLPFFAADDAQLAPQSVLHTQSSGVVYRLAGSTTVAAFVLQTGHRLYLGGEAQPDSAASLASWLHGQVLPRMQAVGEWGVCVYIPTPAWKVELIRAFEADDKCYLAPRSYYERHIRVDTGISQLALPEGFVLRLVDDGLLADHGVQEIEALKEEMCSERASTAEFLSRSFGYALLAGSSVAGWCLSEYNLAQRCEVGIATFEPYQRRGLATTSGLAFLQLALSHGYTRIGWHCWTQNRASAATAEKLGFTLTSSYDCLCCPA